MRNTGRRYVPLLALLAAAAIGCDNTIDPFTGESTNAFAIHGYLNSEADTQFVRISPVLSSSDPPRPDELRATITLTEEASGEQMVWRDTTIVPTDGTPSRIYYSPFRPRPGSTYRLDVAHPSGAVTTARTTLPGLENAFHTGYDENDRGQLQDEVVWLDVSEVTGVVVHYAVVDRFSGRRDTVRLHYSSPGFGNQPLDRTIIRLEPDRGAVLEQILGEMNPDFLALASVGISADLKGEDWDVPDPAAQQIFFPSAARVDQEWVLPDSVIVRLGYLAP